MLRNLQITRPDQVWSSDITYIPLRHGFLYLVAVMDWYSRYVLSWRLSNTLEGRFCVEALDEALRRARPEIFNSDQGSQFTACSFTGRLEAAGVAISMDGRGRALDNVFVERLWRSVKYEEVYLKDYADGWEAEDSLASYFRFYCHERVHQSLGYRTPKEAYYKGGSRNGAGGTIRATASRTEGNMRRRPVWNSSGSSPRTRNWLKVKPAGGAISGTKLDSR